MWEFPGGKLNPGESLADGLRREMLEELGISAELKGMPLLEVADTGSDFVIIFAPADLLGEPSPLEHDELRWVEPDEFQHFPLAPSDHVFVQKHLLKHRVK
jgi:8-oxo-dGTP pyrophosphatase MutT (NUDIX family)